MAPGMGMMTPGVAPGMMAGGMVGTGMMVGPDMNMSVPLTSPAPQQGMTAQGGFVHSMPMNAGCCRTRFFDPLFTQGLPFSFQEYESIIAEINNFMEASLPPKCVQMCPFLMIPCGFLLFVAGGFTAVSTHSFSGPSPIAYVMIALGMLLFIGGGVGTIGMACFQARAVTACRQKLSELNMRFASQKVDFQLHEQQHLQMHTSYDGGMHHGGMHHYGSPYGGYGGYGGRNVHMHVAQSYTLVIQVLDAGGRRSIPAPNVLAEQALQPSAPAMEMSQPP